MAESILENLIYLGAGAFLGFLGSIGFYTYQQRADTKGFQKRLRQELELIREHVKARVDAGTLEPWAFFRDYFSYTKQDLVSKVDAKTWETVLEAYSAIEYLRHSVDRTDEGQTREQILKERYQKALKAIDAAIKRLT